MKHLFAGSQLKSSPWRVRPEDAVSALEAIPVKVILTQRLQRNSDEREAGSLGSTHLGSPGWHNGPQEIQVGCRLPAALLQRLP